MSHPTGRNTVSRHRMTMVARRLLPYGLPFIIVMSAFIFKRTVEPLLGAESPFLVFFAAITISAWYGGGVSGLLATLFAALLSDFFFLGPEYSLLGNTPLQNTRLGLFLIEGVVISLLSEMARRSREREKQQRHWLQVTLSSIGDAVIATDSTGQITFINLVAQKLTGWIESEAVGKQFDSVFQIINEHTRKKVDSPLTKILKEGVTVGLANHTLLITKAGQEVPIDDSGAPIKDDQGDIVGTVLVFRDVSERKQAEDRILRLQGISAALSETLTREQVIEAILGTGLSGLGEQFIAVYLLNENNTALDLIKSKGAAGEVSPTFAHMPLGFYAPMTEAVRLNHPIWIETSGEYKRRYSQLEDLPTTMYGEQASAYLPMITNGRIIGGIVVGFPKARKWDAEEQDFMIAVAHQYAQALDRARLHEEGRAAATEIERQRLARELHDAVNQTLFVISTMAQSIPRLWERQPEKVIERLEQIAQLSRSAMAEMRTLLYELRPDALVNSKLSELLTQLSEVAAGRISTAISLSFDEQELLPLDVRIAFYRIAQEATNNIIKHAEATEITINLKTTADQADLSIKDNGKGFSTENGSAGLGLHTMRERAEKVGASLQVTSEEGQGTEIAICWLNTSNDN